MYIISGGDVGMKKIGDCLLVVMDMEESGIYRREEQASYGCDRLFIAGDKHAMACQI